MRNIIIASVIIIGAISFMIIRISDKDYSIDKLCRWCRLSKLPSDAVIVSYKHSGGLTWDGYNVKFRSTPTKIKQWLAASKGIQSSICVPPSSEEKLIMISESGGRFFEKHSDYIFIISPIPGINFAEVRINPSYTIVEIYAYSS